MSKRIVYYIFLLFKNLLYLTPFWLLYILSDFFCFLLYSVIGYRKKVVYENISKSFPNMDEKEKKRLMKLFYKNLCDILLEGIKGFSMNQNELIAHYTVLNREVMDDYFVKGQDIISVGSHYANWEWGIVAAPIQLKHSVISFYTTLSNHYIDDYMRANRKKLGTEMFSQPEVRKAFHQKKEKPTTYFFAADQSPSNTKGSHWMNFLNQDTPCMKGHEFFAKHYNLPVVYYDVQRIKRGHYTVKLIPIMENSGATTDGEITEKYMRTLEKIIIEKPEDYLWSHRKWKHKRKQ